MPQFCTGAQRRAPLPAGPCPFQSITGRRGKWVMPKQFPTHPTCPFPTLQHLPISLQVCGVPSAGQWLREESSYSTPQRQGGDRAGPTDRCWETCRRGRVKAVTGMRLQRTPPSAWETFQSGTKASGQGSSQDSSSAEGPGQGQDFGRSGT